MIKFPRTESEWWTVHALNALVGIEQATSANADRLREMATEALANKPAVCNTCKRAGHTTKAHQRKPR